MQPTNDTSGGHSLRNDANLLLRSTDEPNSCRFGKMSFKIGLNFTFSSIKIHFDGIINPYLMLNNTSAVFST